MNIGKRIRARRLDLGFTLQDVANRTGVAKSTVHKWETTCIENMRRENILLLAKALNVSPLWIIGIDDKTKNKTSLDNIATKELVEYFDENKEKLSILSKEDSQNLVKLIDLYLAK